MPATRRPLLRGYVIAIFAYLTATALRFAIDPLVGDRVPFATFYAAVTAVAYFGNIGAALLATAVSALTADYFFMAPRRQLSVGEFPDQLILGLFLFTGVVIALLTSRMNAARDRLETAATAADDQSRLIRSERTRLQEIVASVPGVVWEAWGAPDSAQQRIDYVSEYAETMLGYPPATWTGHPNFWLQIVAPEDRARAARTAAEQFASGTEGENEFRWMTKAGRAIWVMARSTVIKDDRGTPVGMRGVTFDITDRKEAEGRLALLAEISTTGLTTPSFTELASHIAQRTADVVGDYCIIRMLRGDLLVGVAHAHVRPEAEPLMKRIASYENGVTGHPVYADLIRHPRTFIDNDVTEETFAHFDRTGLDDLFEKYRARRRIVAPLLSNGRLLGTMAIARAAGPAYTEADARLAGAIAGRAALALDNARLVESAQRDADQARRARAEAEEAGRVKDDFLATLSHELRTPLTAIIGWVQILQDPRLSLDRRQAALATVLRSARSQEQLISDILDVQRITAGKIRLNRRSVDLGDIVRAAAETVQPAAEAKQVRLQLLVDLDVPHIRGDADRLKQVVWNLLTNAIKFSPQGGRVQVRVLRGPGLCELEVVDDGPGIAPEFLPFVFERFRQADSSTTRTHKGLGLGLAIVRSLVEMHGGSIAAGNTAVPGATGAVFTIRLPLGAGDDSADVPEDDKFDQSPRWPHEAPSLSSMRVLVVDDDADVRELLEQILSGCGAVVVCASSAREAFESFTRCRPDVVISDIEMPGEDGYSLLRRIRLLSREAGGDTPVAALTAYAGPADRTKVLAAGFNVHLPKPVEPAELAALVSRLGGVSV